MLEAHIFEITTVKGGPILDKKVVNPIKSVGRTQKVLCLCVHSRKTCLRNTEKVWLYVGKLIKRSKFTGTYCIRLLIETEPFLCFPPSTVGTVD
ncbi:hypothetical protein RUM43_005399 [Polyplax serrata]|uniref:Uncharacterized protein n=1 Tax=Polyplax serrata TaxID=468196 RepID=A0AAN8NZY6_POLSC